MLIERLPIARINEAPYNPRKDLQPDDPEYQALERSIDRWGTVEPLVWNRRTGNLVGGHQRLKILRARGATEVDVSVVDLDDDDEKALNVALNKLGGEFDTAKLVSVLADIEASNAGLLDLTGFDTDDLAAMAADLGRPLFVPATNPEIETSVVTEQDVARAANAADNRFADAGRTEVRDVRCPNCNEEFQISA